MCERASYFTHVLHYWGMDRQEFEYRILEGKQRYWFKRKTYGWGWVPATREGWVVIVVFIVLFTAQLVRVTQYIQTRQSVSLSIFLPAIGLIALLLGICWRTGESPRWQWGTQ